MFDAQDSQTLYSLRLLADLSRGSRKPIVFWIGAGASAWARYPLWDDLAQKLHRQFGKYEATYPKEKALKLLDSKQYPEFFQLCRDTKPERYHKCLVDSFPPMESTPVYERFISALEELQPLYVVTTNIDEMLEHYLPMATIIQRTDLERCNQLIQEKKPLLCKLHGSISSIQSAIFTKEDYEALYKDPKYLALLQQIFLNCSVVFIGYSLSDQYVLSLLAANLELKSLFGDGPHFVVTPAIGVVLPDSVHVIRYLPEPHKDHRSAIQVVEIMRTESSEGTQPSPAPPPQLSSAHFISDIYPEHPSEPYYQLLLERPNGPKALLITGLGWSEEDVPSNASTAMHDSVMSLICFDRTFIPLSCWGRVFNIVGYPLFHEMVRHDILKFVHTPFEGGIRFPDISLPTGFVGGLARLKRPPPEALRTGPKPAPKEVSDLQKSVQEIIRGDFQIVPGGEAAAEELVQVIEASTSIAPDDTSTSLATNGVLMWPQIRRELGISEGTSIRSLPKWVAVPILRLRNVVRVGMICQELGLASTKLLYGSAFLASRAFSAADGQIWADDMASYVLAGRYNTDLGQLILRDPRILAAIFVFRETQTGISLRRDILAALQANPGNDITAAINASLRSSLPPSVLEKAHNEMSGLLIKQGANQPTSPLVWRDLSTGENPLSRWREISLQQFKQYCTEHHIDAYARCPCGSGEKVRFCCEEALSA